MDPDLDRLSDAELLQAYLDSGHAKMVRVGVGLGCVVMTAGCLLPPLLVWLGRAHGRVLLLGPLLALAVCLVAASAWRGSPAHRAVLARFFPDMQGEVRQAAERLVAPQAGSVARVVIYRGRVLPHGGTRWARLELLASDPPQARLDVAAMAYRWDEDPLQRVTRRSHTLAPAQAAGLALLAEACAAGALTELGANPVRDGLPCELAVVSRDRVRRVDGNLAGLSAVERELPEARLSLALQSLASELTGVRGVTGSCDAHGNVVISEA